MFVRPANKSELTLVPTAQDVGRSITWAPTASSSRRRVTRFVTGAQTQGRERSRRAVRRVVYLVVAAALLGLSITGGWLGDWPAPIRWGAHLALALLALVSAVAFVRTFDPKSNGSAVTSTEPVEAFQFLTELRKTARETQIPDAELLAFAERIATPWLARTRVIEDINIEDSHLVRHARVEYRIDNHRAGGGSLFMPLVRPQRGHLVDNFAASSATGERLVTLSRGETLALVAQTIRLLFELSPVGLTDDDDSVLLEIQSLSAVAFGSPNEPISWPTSTDPYSEMLRQFVESLTDSYAVVAIIPEDQLVSAVKPLWVFGAEYTYTIPLAHVVAPTKGRFDRFRSWLRDLAFLPPYIMEVDVTKSLRCGSYHLTVNSPRGYVVQASALRNGDVQVQRRTGQPMAGWHFRVPPAIVQPFTHLYTRGFRGSGLPNPRFRVEFTERLPGSVGRALMTAVLTFFVVWLGGTFSNMKDSGRSEVFALALAFPALAATWMGYESQRSGSDSLSARVSTLVSVVAATAGIGLVAAEQSGRVTVDSSERISILFVTNPNWLGPLMLSLVNAFAIALVLYSRYRRARIAIERGRGSSWKNP